jgi:hypothetical protein
MAPIDLSLGKKILFSSLGVCVNRCLEPSLICTKPAIHAHSVQNAAVMKLLQRAGHVKMLMHDHHNADSFTLVWRDVGRNLATTFEGFCSEHDTSLFAPIDTRPLDVADREQLFLYAYRAVARELHTLMEAAVRTQAMYQKRVAAGIDSGNEPGLAGMMAVEQMMTAHSTFVYKTWLDEALLDRNFKILTHEIVPLAPKAPAIAASVFFDLDTRRIRTSSPGSRSISFPSRTTDRSQSSALQMRMLRLCASISARSSPPKAHIRNT